MRGGDLTSGLICSYDVMRRYEELYVIDLIWSRVEI